MAALVRYFHAVAGYPVRYTWLNDIKSGNYASCPGLTYNNASQYCPSADETIKGHMVQTRQGVRSINNFLLEHPETTAYKTTQKFRSPPNELHIHAIHTRKLYIDDTGRLTVWSRSGNHYVMVAYHSSNVILVLPLKKNRPTHTSLMQFNHVGTKEERPDYRLAKFRQ